MQINVLLICLFGFSFIVKADTDSTHYYMVYFGNKDGSIYSTDKPEVFLSHKSIERRKIKNIPITEKDFPVNAVYLKTIAGMTGIKVVNSSRWLNAAEVSSSVPLTENVFRALPFVSRVQYLGRKKNYKPEHVYPDSEYYERAQNLKIKKQNEFDCAFNSADYGVSDKHIALLGIGELHKMIQNAPGLHIACLDAGFYKAYRVRGMEDLLDSETVIRDFVDYDGSVWEDDQHGTNVLGFMKTFHPGTYIGSAPFARYTLLRTEDARSETPSEEANWLFAAEFSDSLGVDVIAASVGYHSFDDPSLNYKHSDLNGRVSLIARAANEASARGIVVICSAGNEGNGKWKKTGTPADASGVIAIGACDEKGLHAPFSSYGPTADGRVKPDFLAPGHRVGIASAHGTYAGNGTSYSSPIFAGAFACLMQMFPDKTATDLTTAIRFSATHANMPDSAYGYGVPDFSLAAEYLRAFHTDSGANSSGKDLYWNRDGQVYYRNLLLYFRSGSNQSLMVTVKGIKGKSSKNLYRKKHRLYAGTWLRDDILMQLVSQNRLKKNNKRYTSFKLVLRCAGSEFERTIRVN